MRRNLVVLAVALFAASFVSPAFAIKDLNDEFKKIYAGDEADKAFVELVAEAKCNVCHIDKESKKNRNPYGKALHEMFEKTDFNFAEYKKSKEKEKYSAQLKEIFTKLADEKTGDEKYKTFGDRIKAKLLPGGNKDGKQD